MATSKHCCNCLMIPSWIVLILLLPPGLWGQHNGNPLLFQGVSNRYHASVRGSAYGNAFVSRSGDLGSLFYNPGGLAGLGSARISVASSSRYILERDNQNFYPGNEYLNTSLYLEGLITPDPAWNGVWSTTLGTVEYDSLGNPIGPHWDIDDIEWPVQGVDDYSHQAADHEKVSKNIAVDHLTVARPIPLMGKHAVACISYNRDTDLLDYDWNGAHLDPHWGTSDIIQGNEGDTIRTDWSVFTREREGSAYSITGALALQLSDHLQLGVRISRLSGKTEDRQGLDRIGYFLTRHQLSSWAFSYDTSTAAIQGTSLFRGVKSSIGALYTSENFNLGANIHTPFTLEREWSYSTTIGDNEQTITYDSSGVDKVTIPATRTLGLTIKPRSGLSFSFEIETTPFSKTDYQLDKSHQDSLTIYTKWVDQKVIRFGMEYALSEALSLLGGYQSRTAPFIPYGAALRDEGPPGESYSFGLSWQVAHGRLDAAYTIHLLKYYDAYITNRNFTLEQYQRYSIGYTFIL